MFRNYKLKNFDFLLVALVITLNVIGILAIGSAKQSVQGKQMIGMGIGLVLMLIVAFLDYTKLLKLAWLGYAFAIVTLVLVLFFGREANGAKRWLDLGFFDLQPSETAKILLILFYAQFIMKYKERLNTPRILLSAICLILPPLALIHEQPNLSTTILVALLFCVLLFVGGLSWKIIGSVLAVVVPTVLVFLSIVVQEDQTLLKYYQRNRIMAFFNPQAYAGHRIRQKCEFPARITDRLHFCHYRGGAWLYRLRCSHYPFDAHRGALRIHRTVGKRYCRHGHRVRCGGTDRHSGIYEYCSGYHAHAEHRTAASVCQLRAKLARQRLYRDRSCPERGAAAKEFIQSIVWERRYYEYRVDRT